MGVFNEIIEKWTANNIGSEGANKISESLKINTTLTQLNMYGNWNTATNRNDFDTICFFTDNKISDKTKKALGIWWCNETHESATN